MAEQELDLFEFAAGGAAEFGAGAAQVVGLELQSQFPAVKPDRSEHGLRRERRAGDPAVPVERAEHAALANPGGVHLEVERELHPGGHRNRPHPAVFAAEIDDHPAAVALLDVLHGQRHRLAAAQAAADQQCEQGSVALAFQRRRVGTIDETFGLRAGEPVPCRTPCCLMPAAVSASSHPLAAASRASFFTAARR